MADNLKKIIQIMKKTGDKCIVFDNPSNEAFVVMGLGDYEALIDKHEEISQLTEKQFLERINREIAVWKSAQEDESFSDWEFSPMKKDEEVEDRGKTTSEDVFYFEPID
jgi:hypothetical protein